MGRGTYQLALMALPNTRQIYLSFASCTAPPRIGKIVFRHLDMHYFSVYPFSPTVPIPSSGCVRSAVPSCCSIGVEGEPRCNSNYCEVILLILLVNYPGSLLKVERVTCDTVWYRLSPSRRSPIITRKSRLGRPCQPGGGTRRIQRHPDTPNHNPHSKSGMG